MSEVKVNKITPTTNCGTVTLGDSGDTLAIPCGVTLSNAGSITNSGTITNTGTISGGTITGTIDNQVNWDTTAKTAGFTAVAGNGYFVNTTSGAITVTLPATPTAGDLVGIKDYANTADTNNITIDRNGSNIQGTANDFIINTEGAAVTFIYVDGTQGWLTTASSIPGDLQNQQFITATGGTVTCCGDYKIHTFTGPGTFTVTCAGNPLGSSSVDYLVIAGGGGGGSDYAGGGGAGGYRESSGTVSGCYTVSPLGACVAALPVTATAYPITVGSGGAGGPGSCGVKGTSGNPSTFSTITSTGGGGGGAEGNDAGVPGGSGGGSSYSGGAGLGNTPPTSPPQGNDGGGAATGSPGYTGSGGGGAGAVGGCGTGAVGGSGGNGATSSINATPTTRAGGGGAAGGGSSVFCQSYSPGPGGSGGGGAGAADTPNANGGNGSTNTGSGGGGGSSNPGSCGGSGGSGIVIIRYKYQ